MALSGGVCFSADLPEGSEYFEGSASLTRPIRGVPSLPQVLQRNARSATAWASRAWFDELVSPCGCVRAAPGTKNDGHAAARDHRYGVPKGLSPLEYAPQAGICTGAPLAALRPPCKASRASIAHFAAPRVAVAAPLMRGHRSHPPVCASAPTTSLPFIVVGRP